MSATTILHPTDFSAHADHAFALACSLARASGRRLLVLHVAPIPLLGRKPHYREEMKALRRYLVLDVGVDTGMACSQARRPRRSCGRPGRSIAPSS